MAEKRQFQTHIDLNDEERKLFLMVKSRLMMRGKTVRAWFVEQLRKEIHPLHE